MKRKKIETGIIDEKKLLSLFATEKQVTKYKEYNKFTGNNKSTVLKEASRWCKVEDLGKRKYHISEVFDTPIPKNIDKMQAGIYQYLIPLLLYRLLKDFHHNENKLNITVYKMARLVNLINPNYGLIKYNKVEVSRLYNMNLTDIVDYFDKVDSMLNSYIKKSLEYLSDDGFIKYKEIYIAHKEKIRKSIKVENNNITATIKVENVQATRAEINYYNECVKIADKAADIGNNVKKRYFGIQSVTFEKVLKQELKKKSILYMYKAIQIYYTDYLVCNNLLQTEYYFTIQDDIDSLVDELTKNFIDTIYLNASKRYNEKSETNNQYNEDYLDTIEKLSLYTIDPTYEYITELKSKVNESDIEHDIELNVKKEWAKDKGLYM